MCTACMQACVICCFTCPTLCDPMAYSPPGSSVHGILQRRILEWVAMPSFRGSSGPKDRIPVSSVSCIGRWGSLPYLGSPNMPLTGY